YADFAAWQRTWLQGAALESQVAYWRKQLAGASMLRLPTDYPAPPVRSYRGARYEFEVPTSLSLGLEHMSQQEGVTLFMLLLAGFQTLLSVLSGQQEVVVGTDVANRTRVETEGLIGFFINQIVLRGDLRGHPTLREVLGRVRRMMLEASAHQDLPFEKLVEELQPQREGHQQPFFQVKLLLQTRAQEAAAEEAPHLPGVIVSQFPLVTEGVQGDLILSLLRSRKGLNAAFLYSTDLFEEATIARMARQFITVLEAMVRNLEEGVDTLASVLREEQEARVQGSRNRQRLMQLKPKAINLQETQVVQTGYLSAQGTLPLVIRPGHKGRINLLDWSQGNRQMLEEELLKHGAILFRDFNISSLAEFERFGELLDEHSEHTITMGEGKSDLYTSIFYPPEKKLLWHNENSFNHSWPRKIWFYCAQPAEVGGETPLVDSRAVFQHLDPQIQDAFLTKQIMYVRNYGEELGLPWQTIFRTTEKQAVEAYCRSANIGYAWKDGNRLRTWQVRPAILTHPERQERLWWNQATHWHPACLEPDVRASLRSLFAEEEMPRHCFYGDGSPIEDAVMQEVMRVYAELEVSFPWQQGDILMVENMLVAHARNPFDGPRKIYVSMGDMLSLHDLERKD
ncbi:MAG TPA: condensation domain-containing protein, partial [Ktedonobacteraceae bacterium]|nr:condensation domain-containing protein [Ktedonobacteraceae bacterium]